MSSVSAQGIAVANYTYDADGRRTGKTMGNGAGSTWVYDDASKVLGIGHANGGGVFASREYTYDTTGRRTSMTSRQPGYEPLPDEYLHDPLDQIAGVRYAVSGGVPARTVDYLHDAVGNRQQVTEDGLTTAYGVNDLNQYTAVGGQALSYSTNGNLVAMPGAAFSYDAQNRVVSASNGTNTVAFAYDGRNRCVARTVNGATTWMIWNEWSLIEERDGAGAAKAAYIHGARIDEVLARLSGETALLYHEDALGSAIALTDIAGKVVEQYRYDVFGQPSVFDATGQPLAASAAGNRFLFTGREWLPELGLYDYRNRVYSPVLGRWLQPDPIGVAAGDVNLYRYCQNHAEREFDPLGLVPPTPEQFKDPRNWTNGLPKIPSEALEALRVNILALRTKAYEERRAHGENAGEIVFELRRPITGSLALRKQFTPLWFEADRSMPVDFTRRFGLNGAVVLPPQSGTTVIRVHSHNQNPEISDNPDKRNAAGIPQGILTPGDVFKVYDPKSESITEMRIPFH